MLLLGLGLGLVLAIEGLALALAPSRLEELVAVIARMPLGARRLTGLAMLAVGVLLVWLVQGA